MPTGRNTLLIFAIVALATPSVCSYSSWNKISPSGPSIGPVTGHVGVPDHTSDAAFVFGGHSGDSIRSTNDVWMFTFHGKSWEKISPKSSHPPARHGHCGTSCSLDSRTHALFFGGASATGSLMNDVWALSLGPNYIWRQFSPASLLQPSPRTHSACVCLNSSSFIVFGGRDLLGANGEIWLMNLPTRTWKILDSTSPMPGPSFGTCIHALGPSRLFLFGGFNSQNIALNDAWVLDVDASDRRIAWRYLDADPNPPARGLHACMGAPPSDVQRLSDTVYIRGGIGSGEPRYDNILQDMWSCGLISKDQELNFRCRSVVFTSALPLCSQCVSVFVSNIVLVHGGLQVGGKTSSETKLLSLADMKIESMLQPSHIVPGARSGASMVFFTHYNSKHFIFLHGGSDSVGALMSDTWLFDIGMSRWSHLNTTAAPLSPPPRSHACSVLLNHLIIVHGGKRTSVHLDDSPWMFNTVSNHWSPLLSAKTHQSIPSPRWGHACLLLPTPGMGSSLAISMYLQGGISTVTNASLDDTWSLDLDFVVSLREPASNTMNSESLPQILTIHSHLKQFLRFKLAPTYNSPLSTAVVGSPSAFADSACIVCKFKGPLSLSGFSHSFEISTWLRIIPPVGKPLPYLIFELQRPFSLNFDYDLQHTLLRLYLKNSSLELVDFGWKTCRNCLSNAFRVVQNKFDAIVTDGLWHHVTVSISTDLHKIPSSLNDTDLLYLFGTEDCTGPNVTTVVGVDFCDRSDIQNMLNESNSDRVKCVYNPGNEKRVRFAHACQSSTPSHVSLDQRKNIYSGEPEWDYKLWNFDPLGSCHGCKSGAHWLINAGQKFRLPVLRERYGNPYVYETKISAILYCRELWQGGEAANWANGECTDHPLRGASRVAKIYIDGIEVASGSHFDRPSGPESSGVNLFHANLRIAYPYVSSYLYMNNHPNFNDKLDFNATGTMANNYLTMQLGNISFSLFDASNDSSPPRPLPPPPLAVNNIGLVNSSMYHWSFQNSSISRTFLGGVSTFQDCISSVTSRCTQLWWNFLTLTMPSTRWHCVTLTMPPLWWNFVNHQNVNIPPCGWNFLTLQVHLAGWNCPTLKSATMEGWTCNVTVPEGHGCVQMVTSK